MKRPRRNSSSPLPTEAQAASLPWYGWPLVPLVLLAVLPILALLSLLALLLTPYFALYPERHARQEDFGTPRQRKLMRRWRARCARVRLRQRVAGWLRRRVRAASADRHLRPERAALPAPEEYYRLTRASELRRAAARALAWGPRLFWSSLGLAWTLTAGTLAFGPPALADFLGYLPVWLWALWLASLVGMAAAPLLLDRAGRSRSEADTLEREHHARYSGEAA